VAGVPPESVPGLLSLRACERLPIAETRVAATIKSSQPPRGGLLEESS